MGLSPRKVALPEATLMGWGRFSSSSVLDQSNYAQNGRVQQGSAPELDGRTGMYSESNGWDYNVMQGDITWGLVDGVWNVSLKTMGRLELQISLLVSNLQRLFGYVFTGRCSARPVLAPKAKFRYFGCGCEVPLPSLWWELSTELLRPHERRCVAWNL